MSTTKKRFLAAVMTIGLLGSASGASANPVERFCDGPRDGKAVVQRTVCPLLP